MAVVFKLRIYFMYVVARCLHFVMSYMTQNKEHKQTLESAQYGLEISCKHIGNGHHCSRSGCTEPQSGHDS